jgi:predicted phage tail component-like protein
MGGYGMIGFSYKKISLTEFKLGSRSINRPMLPVMRPRNVQIYGKSGIVDHYNNDYETRQISVDIAFIGDSYTELRSRAREIAAWLHSEEWNKLIFDDEPDKYYWARIYSGVNLENLYRVGRSSIVFECQPFAYMVINTDADPTWEEADFPWEIDMPWEMNDAYSFTATESTSFEFENPGTIEVNNSSPQNTKFYVVVTGSWTTLSVTLNERTLEYVGAVSGMLEIKNIDMEVTLDGVNKLDMIEGDLDSFLRIVPGQNLISVDGTGLDITVEIVFSPMWL